MMVGGGEQVELVDARHLAQVRRAIIERPYYLNDRPIAVDHELWHHAERELRELLAARGWPMVAAPIEQRNFMLLGVPVVMTDG